MALINRVLSRLRDGPVKSTFLPAAGIILLGGGGVFGYASGSWRSQSGFSYGYLSLALVLLGLAGGEVHYRLGRARYKASPPVSRRGKSLSLRHPFTQGELQVLNYQAVIPGWGGESLRVAHFSDLHLHRHSAISYFREVVEQVNRSEPDLIFITGDFAADLAGVASLPEVLRPLSCRLGVYAILGNHDYWTDSGMVAQAVSSAGVCLLYNGGERITLDGQGSLRLLGCESPWNRASSPTPVAAPGEVTFVLSHTADHAYHFSREGAAVVFSGHYHAGQMQVPGFGPLIVPSRYGRRFYHGHYRVGETHLFVTAGVGESHPPLRVYCPPDIFIVDLVGDPPQI